MECFKAIQASFFSMRTDHCVPTTVNYETDDFFFDNDKFWVNNSWKQFYKNGPLILYLI